MNTNLIEQKITSKTKVIIPVHIYGQPVNMTEITRIVKKYNLKVIEDCAKLTLPSGIINMWALLVMAVHSVFFREKI